MLAPDQGRARLAAGRHTANGPVHTRALVLAVGLEVLPVGKETSIQLTTNTEKVCTHSDLIPRPVLTVVTVQTSVRIAGVSLRTHISQLFRTRFTAAAAVRHQTDSRGAIRGRQGAGTWPHTVLGAVGGVQGDLSGPEPPLSNRGVLSENLH